MTHLFDLGKPFFVAGQLGHEGLVLHPFPVQLLSFISSSIASCQHPVGLWELCSATPYTHTCTEQSADSYDTDTLCHNLLAIIFKHTHSIRPHTLNINTTLQHHEKTSSPAPPAHTRIPKNVQSRGESSTSAECAAAVGSGAQGWGIHRVLMSSKLASRPLQFCCSIRASVQRLRKNNRHAHARQTPTESARSPRNLQ